MEKLEKAEKVVPFARRIGGCPAVPVFAERFDEVLQQSHVVAKGVAGHGRPSASSKR